MLTKAQIKRRMEKVSAIFYRIGLKNRNFSIISNNCWGGKVYDMYALQYLSPTVGLWIPPEDFCRFCKNIKHYLKVDLVQITYLESHVRALLEARKKTGRYELPLDELIIGRIEDVDIVFLHYTSFEDAKEKWNRRRKRVNFDNILIKLNDQNGCTEKQFDDFCDLDYEHKLFFTAKEEWCKYPYCIFLEKYEREGYVVSDTLHGDVPMNVKRYLNGMIEK